MAITEKNIVITPNIGSSTADPKIVFSGADASTSAQNITLQVYPVSNGTLSFEGSVGQLFSISNTLSGTIFSVNDISGIPSIEVLDTGLIKLGQYSGNVLIGTGTSSAGAKLEVAAGTGYPTAKFTRVGTAAQTGAAAIGMSQIGFSGSTNADTILRSDYGFGLQVNGVGSVVTALVSDLSGNVGIGTSTPLSRLDVREANRANSTNITNLGVYTTTAQAADVGGTIGLGGIFDASTGYASFGSIRGGKENGTSNNYAGYLAFQTIPNGGVLTERMRLDSSGNLGLGVTPSAWSASFKALQVSNFGIMVGNTGNTYQLGNAYFDGSAYKYLASSYALKYEMVGGVHAWYTAPSGTAGNAITFTQAMTLDSAGQLGIGLTPNAPLSVRKDSSTWEIAKLFNNNGTTAGCVLQFNNNVTPANGWDVGVPNADQFNVRRNASAVFSIDSSGRAMVGTVSVLTGNPALSVKSISQYTATFQQYQNIDYVGVRIENVYAQSAQNATMVQLVNSGGAEVGSIKSTGSATSFNTSSDRRLKSNITAAGDSSIVDDIEVVQYDWSNGGGHVAFGVVAQDLHGVFPDAVSAGDGGVDVSSPWGVDYSKLVPLLLKEIQQLRSRVAALESK